MRLLSPVLAVSLTVMPDIVVESWYKHGLQELKRPHLCSVGMQFVELAVDRETHSSDCDCSVAAVPRY